MEIYRQEELFQTVSFPGSASWNLWHGCTRVSPGCAHCYVFRRDAEYGKDTTVVTKTGAFRKPVQRLRSGPRKGEYKYPPGTVFYTCFTSDFFHPDADAWRPEAWRMIRERSDCSFFMVTKRPERILDSLPADWLESGGYGNVEISCTCENQAMADRRLPAFLELPVPNKSITHEPMLERIDIRPYLSRYGSVIRSVSCGGESGPDARICDFDWVLDVHAQCLEYGVPFFYHQTGARLRKNNKIYQIPREHQHSQAPKADLDTY